MHELLKRYGEWALVAGAAEGIGEAFTIQLFRAGFNVILVDINAQALKNLAEKLEPGFAMIPRQQPESGKEAGIVSSGKIFGEDWATRPDQLRGSVDSRIKILCLDLASTDAASVCMEAIRSVQCRFLVYVAAFSKVTAFTDLAPVDVDRFIDTNNRTLIHLVQQFANERQNGNRSGILLISSLAGLIGPPLVATYAATKGFIILLAESLHHEMKQKDIDVTACCAGVTETPMFLSTRPKYGLFKPQIQKPETVAAFALKMVGRKAICISGRSNRAAYFLLTRILPRKISGKLVARNMIALYK